MLQEDRSRSTTAGGMSTPSRIRSLLIAAARRGICLSAVFIRRQGDQCRCAITLSRFDSRADDIPGHQVVDATALGSS